VFWLFPPRLQGIATTVAGVLAVLAPRSGPTVGGWIPRPYTWHWLFPHQCRAGYFVGVATVRLLAGGKRWPGVARSAGHRFGSPAWRSPSPTLEIALKEAPGRGWLSPFVFGLLAATDVQLPGFARRFARPAQAGRRTSPLTDPAFGGRLPAKFVSASVFSGSVYLMPVFLGLVCASTARWRSA